MKSTSAAMAAGSTKALRLFSFLGLSLALPLALACGGRAGGSSAPSVSYAEADSKAEVEVADEKAKKLAESRRMAQLRSNAQDAAVFGYPLVAHYKTLYNYFINPTSAEYKGPFNRIHHSPAPAKDTDTAVVSINADTPYSFLAMDLRAEPLVISLPKVSKRRYFSVQLVDLYTHNFAYLGTRATGNEGGDFLVAGPAWQGEKPDKIDRILRSETSLVLAIFRTQLFRADDRDGVAVVQASYKATPLSKWLGQKSSPELSPIPFPPYSEPAATGLGMFRYLDFLLQFCPEVAADAAVRDKLRKIGVAGDGTFDPSSLDEAEQKAAQKGAQAAMQAIQEAAQSSGDSAESFGARAAIGSDYLRRAAAAYLVLYGNSKEEAMYFVVQKDAEGAPLDGSQAAYTLKINKSTWPPARAFWSVTLYDATTRGLVANELQRYSIGSATVGQRRRNLTLTLQQDDPGNGVRDRWLPTPKGQFYAVWRLYLPEEQALDGTWQPPFIVSTTAVE